MLRKLFRFFLIPLQIAVICLLIAAGAFLWRLHQGPININKFIPYLVQIASSSDTATDISIESAEMRWGGIHHLIEFSVTDFKAFDDNQHLILSVPQLSFSFSPAALFHGTIAPRTLVIYHPYLNLTLNKQGELKQTEEEGGSTMALETLLHILKREKHLSEFSLIKANIKITDALHDAVWKMPVVNLTYSRRFRSNTLKGSVQLALDDQHNQILKLNGFWKRKSKKIPFTIQTDNLDLMHLVPVQKYPYMKNFTTPISLTIDTLLDTLPLKTAPLAYWRKAIDKISFKISGGRGIINLPDPVIARYDLEQFEITGSMHNSADGFDISHFDLVMQSGARAQGSMTISGIGEIIDAGNWDKIQATLNAETQNVPMNMLPSYWPASLGPNVHAWVKRNLRGGMINSSKFVLHFKGLTNDAGIEADLVDGTIKVTDTQVVYLDDMPPADHISGQIHLTLDDLIVTVEQAVSNNVTAEKGGTFSILGMTQPVTTAVLDIKLNGKVPNILEILNSPALLFMNAIGIDPQKTTGTAQGNLQLTFPLGDAFKSADQIHVKANADVRNADVNDIILGLGLQDAILKFSMDGKDLSLNGSALFYGATAKYSLEHSFDEAKKKQTEIKLHVNLNNKARDYLNYPFFTVPAVSGVMPTDLTLVLKNNDTAALNITADLTAAEIDLREIGWLKPAKTEGHGAFALELAKGLPTKAPLISLTDVKGTKINGKINFTAKGLPKDIDIDSIVTQRTNARVNVSFSKNGDITVNLEGKDLDISRLLSHGTSLNIRPQKEEIQKPVTIQIQAVLDRLWLSQKGYSEKNTFSALHHDGWENMRASGYVGRKKVPQHLLLEPAEKEGDYTFSMVSEDAGYTLKALDYISTVKGGRLELNGIYTTGTGSKGTATMSDFYLENDQTLIQVLQLTSLTGILDTLRGEGLFFDKAEIPYTTNYESLTIDSALISGSSLGITLNGKYYRQTGYMNLYGSLIPFYSVNSLLGKIPLIGGLFSGEKGGGLIAPTYTIKGKLPSPHISVNGFSALAPGAIRSMFGKIAREEGDLSKEEETQQKTSVPEKKDAFKPIDPASQTEITDEELHREPKTERVLDP
ncbi:MAG: AsmA-like C-terminal domain-containing protein [Alphaproteobacteria bacterium]|nr:AsmA-like C-terminal domain-containing protein [Alphaproteobacteria bacterium]